MRNGGVSEEETCHVMRMTPGIGRISAEPLLGQEGNFFFFNGKLNLADAPPPPTSP